MPNKFQNTNIEVAEVEAKMASTGNMKYILTGTNKNKYYFYQKNKGVDCDVFQSFNNMGVKQGSMIAIGFTEEQKEFKNPKGEVIKYTDRFIGSMREASGVPQAPVAQNLPQGQALSYKAEEQPKDEKFWDKKAYKQCLWGYWLKNVGTPLTTGDWMNNVWTAFNQIEQDAEKRYAVGWAKAEAIFGEDAPPLDEAPPEVNIPF